MKVQTADAEKEERVQEKRKRRDEVMEETESSSSSDSSSSKSEEEEPKEKKQKREKVDELERVKAHGAMEAKTDTKMSTDLHVAHECLTAITEVRTINKQIHFDMQDKWNRAVFDIKRILKRQAEFDAHTTDDAAADVTARALEAAALVFKKVEMTDEHTKEVQSLTATLTYACSKNELLRSYFHRVRAQLESVEMEIRRSMTKDTEDSGSKKTAFAGSKTQSKSLGQQLGTYRELIIRMRSVPKREKSKFILEALGVMQQVMIDDSTCECQGDIRRSIEHVRNWIGEVPLRGDLAEEYIRFANTVTAYSKRLDGKNNQGGWQSLATSLVALLNEKRGLSVAKTSRSPPLTYRSPPLISKATSEMKGRLASILTQVEQWQDGIFSMGQVDKVMKTLGVVMAYKSKEWNPPADSAARTCVEKLKACIRMIKKQAHRDKRLKTVKKWKCSINKYR
ncbi:hypothetical protein PRIC1_011427 [Phytophthora ramorum]